MKKLLCFTLVLITLLSFAVLPVSAASTIKFKFTLNPDKKSYTVSGDSSYTYPTSFTIPSSYNGKPVTIIDEGAFAGCSSSGYVKAVTIPASVETIGNHAFCEFDGNGGICPKTIYILNKDVYFGYHAIGYYVWGYYSEDDVFSDPTFYGYPGSTTEKYCAQETSFTFKSLTLSAPKLTSTKNGKGYVTFKWEAVSGADSYLVYHKEGSGSWVQLGTTTSTSFKDTEVTSGKKYTYTVKAHNKYGYGTYNKTGIVSGYTNAPVLKSAAASSVGITVKWNAVTGATGYNIYRKAPGASSWTKIGTAATTSYSDATVKYGSSYTYTVIATVKFDGKTYNSTYDSAGLTAKATKVPTPTNPTAAVTKKGTVTVKWDKIQGATKYTVYRSEKADSGFQTLKTVTSTSYADATVKLGKTYYYKIVAYIGSNKSSASKACSIAATIPVPAVKNYVAVTTSSTKLYWDKVADATGYFIYRRVPGGSWSKIATIKNNSTVNYTDKTKGTFDYLMCAYITSNGKTYKSANTSAIRSVNLATPKLTIKDTDEDFISLISWKKVANATSYQLYRKVGSGSWALYQTFDAKTLSYKVKCEHLKDYDFKIRAVSKNNGINSISAYSNSEHIKYRWYPDYEIEEGYSYGSIRYIDMYIRNNGISKMRIYSSGAHLTNPGYSSHNSNLKLCEYDTYEEEYVTKSYIDIPADSGKWITWYATGSSPWYYSDSYIYFNFKYDTINYTSYYSDYEWHWESED